MKADETRRIVLETLEVFAKLQWMAIEELKGKIPETGEPSRRRGRRRQSLVDMFHRLLTDEEAPMHVSQLVDALRERFDRITDRDALSSALAKEARQGLLFRQTAPATFAALPNQEVDA